MSKTDIFPAVAAAHADLRTALAGSNVKRAMNIASCILFTEKRWVNRWLLTFTKPRPICVKRAAGSAAARMKHLFPEVCESHTIVKKMIYTLTQMFSANDVNLAMISALSYLGELANFLRCELIRELPLEVAAVVWADSRGLAEMQLKMAIEDVVAVNYDKMKCMADSAEMEELGICAEDFLMYGGGVVYFAAQMTMPCAL